MINIVYDKNKKNVQAQQQGPTLRNDALVAKIGVDTAEVWPNIGISSVFGPKQIGEKPYVSRDRNLSFCPRTSSSR